MEIKNEKKDNIKSEINKIQSKANEDIKLSDKTGQNELGDTNEDIKLSDKTGQNELGDTKNEEDKKESEKNDIKPSEKTGQMKLDDNQGKFGDKENLELSKEKDINSSPNETNDENKKILTLSDINNNNEDKDNILNESSSSRKVKSQDGDSIKGGSIENTQNNTDKNNKDNKES